MIPYVLHIRVISGRFFITCGRQDLSRKRVGNMIFATDHIQNDRANVSKKHGVFGHGIQKIRGLVETFV